MGNRRSVSILGTRGIPAQHGGFETFAEALALYLQGRGWKVTVYCQEEGSDRPEEREWRGVCLVGIPSRLPGPAGTVEFDFKCTLDALRRGSRVNLTLGYNTALFGALFRLFGRYNIFNMDGLEWKRSKWSAPVRAWFYVNERLGCWLGNGLIADNPEIARHLAARGVAGKVVTIPYGADQVRDAPDSALAAYGLQSGRYALIVARAEPENSILEMVAAFSTQLRGIRLVVLGSYDTAHCPYHAAVQAAASAEVIFPGAIYDKGVLSALRFHALAYFHGHQVGGTNPSLVEALGAGCPVLAHDNPYNRWVAGAAALYFGNSEECRTAIDTLIRDPERRAALAGTSRQRHTEQFTWPAVLDAYERLLLESCGERVAGVARTWM